ncbi:MAG: class I SAM-dependent methyltransferase [Deltaproteobacteria bacterium]|nr:class I SAM-dependent methyltransferase [Deltaproteobacteria bacterium]
MNLVGATDPEHLAGHVQEALQCVACAEVVEPIDASTLWVDVGSGGGLPGLVVAAIRPCPMVLIEPRERRAAFLDLGLASVGTAPGRVIRARWSLSTWNEKVVSGLKSRSETKFTVLSARAVFAPETWLQQARSVSIPRGIILCHVESNAEQVDGKKPRAIVRGPSWAVMAYDTRQE